MIKNLDKDKYNKNMSKLPVQLTNIINNLLNQRWHRELCDIGDVYIVGGSVRDAFISKPIKDVDLIVDNTTLDEIIETLKPFGKVSLVGDSFAVIKFKPTGEKEDIDIAVPRIDRKIGTGHKGFKIETEGVDIFSDLKRRDFTINSIAVSTETGELLDPFNGLNDLKNGILRATDIRAFIEDPLRMLRGVQFASRFNFNIEPNTLKMMKQNAHLISEIKGERIKEEFEKIISKKGNIVTAFNILKTTGLDKELFGNTIIFNYNDIDKLDSLSFFYLLGLISNQSPAKFFKERLKGEANEAKFIQVLDDTLKESDKNLTHQDFRWLTFKLSWKFPEVLESVLLPDIIQKIKKEMEAGWLPISPNVIAFSGDDIIKRIGDKNGPLVGKIQEQMFKDALNDLYLWKERKDTLEHLDYLISKFI